MRNFFKRKNVDILFTNESVLKKAIFSRFKASHMEFNMPIGQI
jgi:hypothetical protein